MAGDDLLETTYIHPTSIPSWGSKLTSPPRRHLSAPFTVWPVPCVVIHTVCTHESLVSYQIQNGPLIYQRLTPLLASPHLQLGHHPFHSLACLLTHYRRDHHQSSFLAVIVSSVQLVVEGCALLLKTPFPRLVPVSTLLYSLRFATPCHVSLSPPALPGGLRSHTRHGKAFYSRVPSSAAQCPYLFRACRDGIILS